MTIPDDSNSVAELGQTIGLLARLVEVSLALNSTLDPDQLLQSIIDAAAELLNCEAASLMLYDEKKCELRFRAATGSDPAKLVEIPVPLEGSLAGTIFRENRHLLINNVREDPRHYGAVAEHVDFQPHTLLGVPMRIRDRVTGVLEALNKREGVFTRQDAHILSVIASQAAVAIRNAQMMQALQQANDELSRLDVLKSRFMAIAAHELRTPLGIILGYATFLKEEAQEKVSEHASMVLNSALHLRTLVEAMTNMNILQKGLAKPKLRPTSVQQLVNSAYKEIASAAEAGGQSIFFDLPEEDLLVQADAEKLELAFENLLNNAIRFTPPQGKITVRLNALENDAVLEIQDTGVGIPPGELKNIFKEFYQVESHLTRHYGGLGLGLALAYELVTLHGGRIWAESEGMNKGATFYVALPLAG